MKTILQILIIVFMFISCSEKNEQKTSAAFFEDDLGNQFIAGDVPQRIITLAPNLTEMIFFLGLENKLVGNTFYCNYPPEAGKISKVGDMLTFNFEKIVTLKPDIIFITVEGNTKETYDKFRELGLKIFVSNPRNYEGIKKTILDLGKLFNISRKTDSITAAWDSTINSIKEFSLENTPGSAAYFVETKPIMLAGKNSFMNEYLEFCGLKNAASDSPLNYPLFNREEILKRDPDFLILPTEGGYSSFNVSKIYPEWKNLSAVKNDRVIFVDRDLYSRPGPRFVEAVKDLHLKIHR